MKYSSMTVVLFICIMSFIVGCPGNIEQKEVAKEFLYKLYISNFSDNYEYVAFLNNEPIYSGRYMTSCIWQGFPMKKGWNELRFVFSTAADISDENNETHLYAAALKGEEQYWTEYVGIPIERAKKTEQLLRFNIKDKLLKKSFYETLSSSLQTDIRRDVKKIVLYIIQLLSSRNFETAAKLFNLEKGEVLSAGYPKWFLEADSDDFKVTHIEYDEDVDILIGEKLVLVKPSRSFIHRTRTKSLYALEHIDKEVIVSESCLSFVIFDGSWCLRNRNGVLFPISKPEKVR